MKKDIEGQLTKKDAKRIRKAIEIINWMHPIGIIINIVKLVKKRKS